MQKIFMFMLFISFTALIVSDIEFTPNGTSFNDYADNVTDYAEASTNLYENGFVAIVNTLESALDLGQSFIDSILFIPRTIDNFTSDSENIGQICIVYDDLSILEKGFLNGQRVLYNLFNESLTPEQYWQYEQQRVWGLECSL